MASIPIELPSTTGSLKQYRIVCCAPYFHKPFEWSRNYRSGYNNLSELDLPTNSDFYNMTPLAEKDCNKNLVLHARKYAGRPWRRHKDWKFVCKLEGDRHKLSNVSDNCKLSMLLLERPIHDRKWSKLRRCACIFEDVDAGQAAAKQRGSSSELDLSGSEEEGDGQERAPASGIRLIPMSWHSDPLFDDEEYVRLFGGRPIGL